MTDNVRKLVLCACMLLIGGVPAAMATTGPAQTSPELEREAPRANGGREGPPGAELEREALRKQRVAHRKARRKVKRRQAAAVPPQLEAIAQCESGGNSRSVSSSGQYRGKYQFSRETWAAVGGSGDPAEASEAEQDRRAAALYARSGAGQWPVCGS